MRWPRAFPLGRPSWPPQPPIIVLTDRADGTEWALSHRQSDNRLTLTDAAISPIRAQQVHRYPAYDGPRLKSAPHVQLFVRSGRLGYETVELPSYVTDVDQGRLLSRRGNETFAVEVIQGPYVYDGDALAWEDVRGTPGDD